MATPSPAPSPASGSVFRWLMLLPVLPFAVRIVQEYERGVIFRLGRLVGAWGPGLFLIIPIMERMVVVDLRVVTMDVPRQDAITRDNVTVRVDAVVFFRVVDPEAAVTKVEDYIRATSLIAQTSLRNVIGQSELDELLSRREEVNQRLQQIIDEATDGWGIKVTATEVRDVSLATEMVRAMARQAEVERERRAKIIHAEGEFQAAAKLAEAGRVMAASPASMQLRYLQTLTEMAGSENRTFIPIPIDIVNPLAKSLTAGKGPATDQGNGSAEGENKQGE